MKLAIVLPTAVLLLSAPAYAQDPHAGHHMPQEATPQPAPEPAADAHHTPAPMPIDHGQHAAHATNAMQGVLGAYTMNREASGTSWQPDASEHGGVHSQYGQWQIMSHALLNGVYDWQDGPRGDEEAFLAGMLMGAARRDFTNGGSLNLRAMLSPDPFMGKDGYPLLFAAGETADGENTLIDRQHPHDLVMELSASYAQRLSATDSVFAYGGLPGEPAFGPPAFMHRMAAMDSPEAPITHHWFDSTHITFGVVTAGLVHENWKVEASRFRGREPDQDRYDIETGDLDSTALRVSWNPTQNLSLQTSWADIESPEALEPEENEERISASGIYTRRFGNDGWWSATLAYANKDRSDGVSLDAWLGEAALHPNDRWTIFSRGERIETDELEGHHGEAQTVSRLSLGAIRDFRLTENVLFGVGALVQRHFAPDELAPAYGGDPVGAMGFVRLKIG